MLVQLKLALVGILVSNWDSLIKCLYARSVSAPTTVSEDKNWSSYLNRSIWHMLRCFKVFLLGSSCWSGPALASFRFCILPVSWVQISQTEFQKEELWSDSVHKEVDTKGLNMSSRRLSFVHREVYCEFRRYELSSWNLSHLKAISLTLLARSLLTIPGVQTCMCKGSINPVAHTWTSGIIWILLGYPKQPYGAVWLVKRTMPFWSNIWKLESILQSISNTPTGRLLNWSSCLCVDTSMCMHKFRFVK